MPAAPYCTSGDVYLLRLYAENPDAQDYTELTQPAKSVVEVWIGQIASQIDMAYAGVGYEIPLAAITGEVWPTHQTTFLKYFNAIGVASVLGADASSPPVVSFAGGRRVDRNFYEAEWTRLLNGVREIGRGVEGSPALIRAASYPGSMADRLLSVPRPPLSDFLEGYQDPTSMDYLRDFTRRHQYYIEEKLQYNLPSQSNAGSYDYLLLLHKALGWTYAQ